MQRSQSHSPQMLMVCFLAAILSGASGAANAQTVQIVPRLPVVPVPGSATAPGTATIIGAQGRGTGTVTLTVPSSLPVIDCPGPPVVRLACVGPVTVQVTHTLTGFDQFGIYVEGDGLRPRPVGNTQIKDCSVFEFINPAPKSFSCTFDWLPYLTVGSVTTRIPVSIQTRNDFVDRNYNVGFEWGPAGLNTYTLTPLPSLVIESAARNGSRARGPIFARYRPR